MIPKTKLLFPLFALFVLIMSCSKDSDLLLFQSRKQRLAKDWQLVSAFDFTTNIDLIKNDTNLFRKALKITFSDKKGELFLISPNQTTTTCAYIDHGKAISQVGQNMRMEITKSTNDELVLDGTPIDGLILSNADNGSHVQLKYILK